MAIQYDHDHENEITFFAETNFRNQRRRFGIKTDDRRRHFYILGKTGMGKTTLLENMVVNDIKAGHGVGVVDPHGDFADKLLDFIPTNRINDVIYFNPADMEWPIGFNVLETVDPSHKHLVASGLMGVFKKIWPDVWSARMEYILNNAILALLEYPGSTLLGINRLLVDKEFRKRVIAKITDPVVKMFWMDEYSSWEARFRNEAIAPIQNKVGQFLSASIIRNIVAQVKSTINMREMMDNGKIFIMNLAKGRIGEDNSRLLGGMLVTRLQLAAMERVDIPETDRRDFYLYVDEFQNFATQSFANILSEARKYHLNLILAHQYIEQLDEDYVRPAVFGNVGTLLIFRIGAADAEFLVNEFTPHFVEEDLVNLTKYDVYLKLMIDGVASNPFSATTLPPIAVKEGSREKIIRISREHYAKPRATIEDKIMRWSGLESEDEEGGEIATLSPSQPRIVISSPLPKISEYKKTPPAAALQETKPILKTDTEVKPISLTEALKQRPITIKGAGPAPKSRLQPTPIQSQPLASPQSKQPLPQSPKPASKQQFTPVVSPPKEPPRETVLKPLLKPTTSQPTPIPPKQSNGHQVMKQGQVVKFDNKQDKKV